MEENKNRILTELPKCSKGTDYKSMVGMELEILYKKKIYKVKVLKFIKGVKSRFIIEYNGETYNTQCNNFINGRFGGILKFHTKSFKINIGDTLKDNKRNITITDREYREHKQKDGSKKNEKWYKYTCNVCGNEGFIIESNLLLGGVGCSCCANQIVVTEINSIWITHRWLCTDYGLDESFAKTHTIGTGERADFCCIHCKKIKKVTPKDVCRRKSIGCSCGDGTSYPEKFMISVLDQLGVEYVFQLTKTTFDWCEDKRYDFYIPSLNTIIETHGMQHYEDCGWSKAKDVQENDRIKYELALQNGISNYIVIDCRYSDKEWVKNNILSSKLNELFDLEKRINWNKCEEFTLKSNIVKEVCEYWNNRQEWETTTTLAKVFGLNKSTIIEYLKKGTALNWCEYDAKKERGDRRVAMYDLDGNFIMEECSTHELARRVFAEKGIKLSPSNISEVCNGKRKHHKGYTFKYID